MKQSWEPIYDHTPRGFETARFTDAYEEPCSVQASSIVGEYDDALDRPGTSALWIGVDRGDGTSERMHLSRDQVGGLAAMLHRWLTTGRLR